MIFSIMKVFFRNDTIKASRFRKLIFGKKASGLRKPFDIKEGFLHVGHFVVWETNMRLEMETSLGQWNTRAWLNILSLYAILFVCYFILLIFHHQLEPSLIFSPRFSHIGVNGSHISPASTSPGKVAETFHIPSVSNFRQQTGAISRFTHTSTHTHIRVRLIALSLSE